MENTSYRIGVEQIGTYIPVALLSNHDRKQDFDIDEAFLKNKIGVDFLSRKNADEETSDMCVKAFDNLLFKKAIDKNDIECLVVVTQNPDGDGLPHTASIVHHKLGLRDECAAFDISLGCSGFVYGLSVIEGFMKNNQMRKGLLFTCDPYSKIVDPADKNTALLFGDAATVSLISDQPVFRSLNYAFGTRGSEGQALMSNKHVLSMDGRAVFNFSATEVPAQIKKLVEKNNIALSDIDVFLLHQGSKYIVDTITRRLGVNADKVPVNMKDMGNTVSSSIPLLLQQYIENTQVKKLLLSGFGVGLSWASTILIRQD